MKNNNNNLKKFNSNNNSKVAKKTIKKNISIKKSNTKNNALKSKKVVSYKNKNNTNKKTIQTISPLTPLTPLSPFSNNINNSNNSSNNNKFNVNINLTNSAAKNYYDGIYQALNNTLNNRIVNNKLGKNQTPLNFIHKKTLFQKGDSSCKKYSFEQHGISRNQISNAAVEVCSVLQKRGFAAFVVGGAVRDLLLGATPKDFDVVTNATPFQVLDSFKSAFLIGRRFQIVHVKIGGELIEVSTFRSKQENQTAYDEFGKITNDNIFGSQSEDAWRRDFTINSFYYNPITQELLDYHNGIKDMSQKILRIIGEPEVRYREDPVRMIRAIRLAAKLQLNIDEKSSASFKELGELLHHVNKSRLSDEMIKILISGYSLNCLNIFQKQGIPLNCMPLFECIFSDNNYISPENSIANNDNVDDENKNLVSLKYKMINAVLQQTDNQVQENRKKGIHSSVENVNVSFIFAALLWFDMLILRNKYFQKFAAENDPNKNLVFATQQAISELMSQMNKDIISRKYIGEIRGIWLIQQIFENQKPNQILNLPKLPQVQEAFRFLQLRHQIGEISDDLMSWWENFMQSNIQTKESLIAELRQLKILQRQQQKALENAENNVSNDKKVSNDNVENNPENDNNNANITANSDDNSCEEIDNDFEEVDLQELEEIKKMLPPLKRRNNKKRTTNKRFLNKAKHKHKHKQK